MAFAIGPHGARGGGTRFFMARFTMNDRGDACIGVAAHPLPYLHYVATGGVDYVAAAFIDFFHEGSGSAKGGHDDDVFLRQLVIACIHFLPGQRDDAHLDKLQIDIGIMDDFSDEKDSIIRKNPARCVGEVNGALDTVAEAKLFGE